MGNERSKFMKGVIFCIAGAVLWSLGGTGAQFLFTFRDIEPLWMVSIRLFCSGILILLFMFCKERKKVFDVWRVPKQVPVLLVFAFFGVTASQCSYFMTIRYSNAGIATVLQYIGPAYVLIYLCLRDRTLPTKREILALFCSIAGVFLLATHGQLDQLAISPKALMWGMLAAVALAVYSIAPVGLMKQYPAMTLLGWSMTLGGTVIMLIVRPWTAKVQMDGELFACLLLVIIAGSIGGYGLYMCSLSIIGSVKASMISCVEPLAAALFSAVWLGVRFVWIDFVGFALVLAVTFILRKSDAHKEPEKGR